MGDVVVDVVSMTGCSVCRRATGPGTRCRTVDSFRADPAVNDVLALALAAPSPSFCSRQKAECAPSS